MKIKNLKFKIKNFNKGFTLIEVVVTIMIVSIMMVLISSIFARAVELERRTVWSQRVQENATFILESMAKEIRVSSIVDSDTSSDCSMPATTLTMVHPTACNGSPCSVTYTLNGTDVIRQAAFTSIINSSDVQFTKLNFCISGSGIRDNQAPKITILMSLRSVKGSPPINANLETTITSRDLTTELQDQ